MKYMGIDLMKFPTDLWTVQEIICEIKPSVYIETGTWKGGASLYYAHLMDNIGCGKVLTIDLNPQEDRPIHPRIQYIDGDSTSKEVLNVVAESVNGGPTIVNLDSAHNKDHVLREMEAYCGFVTEGSYMIVEDGILGHPVMMTDSNGESMLPGPYEAVNQFMKTHSEFELDRDREKFQVICNVKGYLKKRITGENPCTSTTL